MLKIGAFIASTMAENTRLRDFQAKVKRMTKAMEIQDQEQRAHTAGVEAAANALMDRAEAMVNARMEHLEATLQSFMNNLQNHRGGSGPNSNSSSTVTPPARQPFQVRNLKLDFPHFDGTNVMD